MQVDNTTDNIHIIEWRIHNFSSSILMEGEVLESPICVSGNLFHTRWNLRIYPNGQPHYPKSFGCFLKRDKDEKVGPETLYIAYEFSLLSFDGLQVFPKKGNAEFKRGNAFGIPDLTEIKEIFCRKEYLLQSDILVVRCKLQLLPPKKKQTSHQIFETKFATQKIAGQMTLNNFRSISKQNPQILQVRGNHGLFALLVSMNKDETPEGQVATGAEPDTSFLHMIMTKNIWKDPVKVSCCIKLLNKDLEVAIEKEFSHLFSQVNKKEEWVLPHFIDTNKLGNDCTEDDTLYLDFNFTVCDSQPQSLQTADLTPLKVKDDPQETTLMNDLINLHECPKFTDVTLQIGQEKIRAHKSILAVRSQRFDEIFTANTNSENHTVEITDVDKDTMKLLMKFIYTEKLDDDLNVEGCLQLYAAAKKYQIPSLQLQCCRRIHKKMSVNELYKVVITAEEFRDSKLKMGALDLFLQNYQYIWLAPEWKAFAEEHGELATEIMRHIRLKKNQEEEE